MPDEKEKEKDVGAKEGLGQKEAEKAEVVESKGGVKKVTVGPNDAVLLFQVSGYVKLVHNLDEGDFVSGDAIHNAFAIFKAIQEESPEYQKIREKYLAWMETLKQDAKEEKESVASGA